MPGSYGYDVGRGFAGLKDMKTFLDEIWSVVDWGRRNYYVDDANGDDANDGFTWATAFATIGAAMTAAATLGGRGRAYIYVAPGGYDENVVTPLNAASPFGALIGVTPTGRTGGAVYLSSPVTTTPVITVKARGWRISGFEIDAPSASGCILLDGESAGASASFAEISDCLIVGQNQGTYGIDFKGAPPLVSLYRLMIYGFTGSAIISSSSPTDQARFAHIAHCIFVDNSNHINMNPRGFKESLIEECTFHAVGANQSPTQILNSVGGNGNIFRKNHFGGTFDIANGYAGVANDEWFGNYANIAGGITQDDPT